MPVRNCLKQQLTFSASASMTTTTMTTTFVDDVAEFRATWKPTLVSHTRPDQTAKGRGKKILNRFRESATDAQRKSTAAAKTEPGSNDFVFFAKIRSKASLETRFFPGLFLILNHFFFEEPEICFSFFFYLRCSIFQSRHFFTLGVWKVGLKWSRRKFIFHDSWFRSLAVDSVKSWKIYHKDDCGSTCPCLNKITARVFKFQKAPKSCPKMFWVFSPKN